MRLRLQMLLVVVLSLHSHAYAVQTAESDRHQQLSPGVAIQQENLGELHSELAARITAAEAKTMQQTGLVGVLGGAHVKLLKTGTQQILMPIPQVSDAQIPIAYFIRSQPPDAVVEYRLQRREDANDVISVSLKGRRNDDVRLEWSSVILIADRTNASDSEAAEAYRMSTECVQADADEIQKLAAELWPETGDVEQYATNIQRFIREMKFHRQPRSLDALAILKSGASSICTANANLAVALLRAKGIASRSLAVIPPTSQRLEMHRIVEYYGGSQWHRFDPSSLHADIPMHAWQLIVMTNTSIADENAAMRPRMGAMIGCPYAQEVELMSRGVALSGQDFFWTEARPLASLTADEQAITEATAAWHRFLSEGTLNDQQLKAYLAQDAMEFASAFRSQATEP